LLQEALAPSGQGGLGASRFACESVLIERLDRVDYSTWDAVWLVDPLPLAPTQWRNMGDFVQGGGGLAISLGRNAVGKIEAMQAPGARLLIPGPLKWVVSSPADERRYLQPTSYDHPVFRGLSDVGAATPWPAFPVFKWWDLSPLEPSARVVASI